MAPDPSVTPKPTRRSWPRDVLLAFALPVGLYLVLGTLGSGLLWLDSKLNPWGPRRDHVELDIRTIQRALKSFHEKHQRFPSTEEGLGAAVDGHYMKQVPLDPWGHPFGYELRDGQPVLWSYGADGVPGGEGANADISSRDPR
jgi:general secretion pathway protein G